MLNDILKLSSRLWKLCVYNKCAARSTSVNATRELESSKLQLYLTAIATDAQRKLAKDFALPGIGCLLLNCDL